jgi:hypothetical protein
MNVVPYQHFPIQRLYEESGCPFSVRSDRLTPARTIKGSAYVFASVSGLSCPPRRLVDVLRLTSNEIP